MAQVGDVGGEGRSLGFCVWKKELQSTLYKCQQLGVVIVLTLIEI